METPPPSQRESTETPAVETPAITTASASQSIKLTKKTRPKELIAFNKEAFREKKDEGIRNKKAATVAKSRATLKIVNSILSDKLTDEQRVLALHDAVRHPKIRVYSKSAGLIDNDR